jgi:hypothetical protein
MTSSEPTPRIVKRMLREDSQQSNSVDTLPQSTSIFVEQRNVAENNVTSNTTQNMSLSVTTGAKHAPNPSGSVRRAEHLAIKSLPPASPGSRSPQSKSASSSHTQEYATARQNPEPDAYSIYLNNLLYSHATSVPPYFPSSTPPKSATLVSHTASAPTYTPSGFARATTLSRRAALVVKLSAPSSSSHSKPVPNSPLTLPVLNPNLTPPSQSPHSNPNISGISPYHVLIQDISMEIREAVTAGIAVGLQRAPTIHSPVPVHSRVKLDSKTIIKYVGKFSGAPTESYSEYLARLTKA